MIMRPLSLFLMLILMLTLSLPLQAANWLQLMGTEPAQAPRFRPLLLLQPTYTHIDAEPLSGLLGPLAPFNGRHQFTNQVLPDFDATEQFQFLRARLGARGKLTDQIHYFALLEAGQNPMTAQQDLVLSDLSLTFNQLRGARIRLGLFKLPTDEEALVAVNSHYPYTFFSTAVQSLLIEQPVRALGPVTGPITNAEATSGCNCFHDWGIQVFDWFRQGHWELGYAAALSNGGAINKPADADGNKDVTLRLQASYLLGGDGPSRDDLTLYLWRQQGDRHFAGADYRRLREGLGVQWNNKPLRLSAAYLRGDGMITAGFNPPISGNPLAVGTEEQAHGWYLEGGWKFLPNWELDLRHDRFQQMTETAVNSRALKTTTLGLQFRPRKDTRISLNYEWRDAEVSHPGAFANTPAGRTQLANAGALADNLGNRLSLQLSWSY